MKISNTGQKVGNTENSARKQRFLKSKTKKPRSIENEKLAESNKKHSRTGHQETWQAEGRMPETEDGGDGAWRPDISTGHASGKQASKHSETRRQKKEASPEYIKNLLNYTRNSPNQGKTPISKHRKYWEFQTDTMRKEASWCQNVENIEKRKPS